MRNLVLALSILLLAAPAAFAGHTDTKARLKMLLERARARKAGKKPGAITSPVIKEPVIKTKPIKTPDPSKIKLPEIKEPEFTEIKPIEIVEPEPIIEEKPSPAPVPVQNNINIDIDIDGYKGDSPAASPNPYIIDEKLKTQSSGKINSTKDLEDKAPKFIPIAPTPKTEIKTIETPNPSPVIDKASPFYQEEKKTATKQQAPSEEKKETKAKEDNHLLVIKESLRSIEEDSWTKVRTNMNEAIEYFLKEKQLDPSNKDIDIYGNIIKAFRSFSEGGLELDKGDLANFEEAEARYLDAQDILLDVQDKLDEAKHEAVLVDIVETALQYVDEELDYINEMLTM